jgi:hypothetical protein
MRVQLDPVHGDEYIALFFAIKPLPVPSQKQLDGDHGQSFLADAGGP